MKQYYATSIDMIKSPTPKFMLDKGMVIEFNPNIKMFRVNKKGDIPLDIMGYEKTKRGLITKVAKHLRGK